MDDKKTKTARIIVFTAIIIAIVIAMKIILGAVTMSAKYDEFAQCLQKKNTIFYGAFWCSHCQQQEANFGMSREKLASIGLYKECSNPDHSQNALCQSEKVESYPTWVFPDGTRESKVMELSEIAKRADCPLPTATETPAK